MGASASSRPDSESITARLVLLVVALAGGGFGHSRVGYIGWSPAAIIVVVLLVLLLTGHLHR